ncbi:Aldedh domain-containing protein [Fusarium keratoplasticum]|uniref:Aldedh domain-containing protein n=1 Tax=Fusarium keratoplasticum TaxID=1328300 RepID=A0ACC0QCA0_9HYPO|nr:Aldedh domain-containing protein [Fusarium keratoplasticum]KAI8648202.1 Aldedh domain-containing protein [Fusarium keratoplasticum]
MASSLHITLPNGLEYSQPTGLFIDNEFMEASGDALTVINPATEEDIATFTGASGNDVNAAVAAARRAFEGPWSELPAAERGNLLMKLASLIDRDRELLASIDAMDNGKTFSAALNVDIAASHNVFKYYAGAADKLSGSTVETYPSKFAYVLREPLGVCGQIIPWYLAGTAIWNMHAKRCRNFPFMMLAWKVAPALACGNTIVLKPAEQTPLSALYFGKLVVEAGFPPGVVNIVPGLGSVTGKALAEHMDVDKIAFTGSTTTGRAIMRSAASNLKNITLECGGKNPSIVFDDADLDQAVKWCHVGIMDNQGQTCISTSRIYVQEGVYDRFVEKFAEVTRKHHLLGDPFDPNTWQGPQISKAQYEKVLSYIEEGKKSGARLVYGGATHGQKGYFIEPTAFADTTEDMKIVQEEIFGPVVAISKFKTFDEVLVKANNSCYGLSAAVFTENITKGHQMARRLQAGMVFLNSSGDTHYGVPFGGYKSSGIGRELGQYALDAYTQTKAVHVNLGN